MKIKIGISENDSCLLFQRAEKERRAFLEHLARKFPEHAHTIKSTQTINGRPVSTLNMPRAAFSISFYFRSRRLNEQHHISTSI